MKEARKEYRSCSAECKELPRKKISRCRRSCRKDYYKTWRECYAVKRPRNAELVWQPNGYSSSPFQPYWIVEINGTQWIVTQQGEVFKE